MEDNIDDISGELDVFEAFPYLQSFPFPDYTMQLDSLDDFAEQADIDPVIIDTASSFVKPEFVNFNYVGKYTKVTLSFYTYDLIFISENVDHIKKLDSVREALDEGLGTTDIITKIEMIKIGEKFLKKIGASLVAGKTFRVLLDNILETNDISIDQRKLNKIKSMYKTVDYNEFNELSKNSIRSYYNIHLHHIKILLGIVIATKIH